MEKGKVNFFDVIPSISEHITTLKKGDLSVVTFPRFPNGLMQKMFARFAKSEQIHIQLDQYGTAVWDLIDGKRSVKEICETLKDAFASEENSESRIVSFISQLQAKGFVKYKVKVSA